MSCGTSYLLEPNNYGFTLNDGAFFEENGSYLAIGLQKSVRFMEGPKRGRNAALILERKRVFIIEKVGQRCWENYVWRPAVVY